MLSIHFGRIQPSSINKYSRWSKIAQQYGDDCSWRKDCGDAVLAKGYNTLLGDYFAFGITKNSKIPSDPFYARFFGTKGIIEVTMEGQEPKFSYKHPVTQAQLDSFYIYNSQEAEITKELNEDVIELKEGLLSSSSSSAH